MIGSAVPVAGYATTEGLPALIMEPQTAEKFMSNLKQAIYKLERTRSKCVGCRGFVQESSDRGINENQ